MTLVLPFTGDTSIRVLRCV